MRRASNKSGTLNAGIYRHFAVVTLALTGILAMFSSGAGTQAQVAQADAAVVAPGAEGDAIDQAARGKPTNQIKPTTAHSWTYVDSFGDANISASGSGSLADYIDNASGQVGSFRDTMVAATGQTGLPGSDQKRQGAASQATAEQIDQMLAQSRARSGAASE